MNRMKNCKQMENTLNCLVVVISLHGGVLSAPWKQMQKLDYLVNPHFIRKKTGDILDEILIYGECRIERICNTKNSSTTNL